MNLTDALFSSALGDTSEEDSEFVGDESLPAYPSEYSSLDTVA